MRVTIESVLQCLEELADREFQERVWLRGEGPEQSSFTETVCQLFDDSALDDFLEDGEVFTTEIDDLLREIGTLVARIDTTTSHEALLGDPSWQEVRLIAGRTARLLKVHIVDA